MGKAARATAYDWDVPYKTSGTYPLTTMQQRSFEDLREHYGSHRQAAFALGLTPRHYFRLRRGNHRLIGSTRILIETAGRMVRRGRRKKAILECLPPLAVERTKNLTYSQ